MARKRLKFKVKPAGLTIMMIVASLLLLIGSLLYFGALDVTAWIPTLLAFGGAVFLIVESSYMKYLRASGFKKLKFMDMFNIFTLVIAGLLIGVGITTLGLMNGALGSWFQTTAGTILGLASVTALIHIFIK